MMSMRQSIRRRLPLSYITVAVGPLLLVGLVLVLVSFSFQFNQALSKQIEVAKRVSTELNAFLSKLEAELQTAAREMRGMTNFQRQNLLARLPSYPHVFQELILADNNGAELVYLSRLNVLDPLRLVNWANTDVFALSRAERKPYYSDILIDDETGQPSMLIGVPIINPQNGVATSVLIANVRFKPIWDLVAAVQLDAGENVFITDAFGRIVAHLNPSVVLQEKRYQRPAMSGIGAGESAPTVVVTWTTRTYGNQTFVIVAERNVLNALEFALWTAVIALAVLALAIVIAAVTGRRAAQRVVVPIGALVKAAQALSERSEAFDPAALAPIAMREDEFGQLARTFQAMGEQVIIREQTLKQEVQELRIEIDEAKKSRAVAEITDSEFFKELQSKAARMRQRTKSLSSGGQASAHGDAETLPAQP
jgi:HAMP domain-containing protein